MPSVFDARASKLDASLQDGHYAKKQILCKDPLISWSHTRRFLTGVEIAQRYPARRILDYGCGDGTLLALLSDRVDVSVELVGCEIHPEVVEECTRRLGGRRLKFCMFEDIDDDVHHGSYDLVLCMEVLEHVVEVDFVLDRLERMLAPSGRLIISVPVEVGLPLLVKQAARRIAGWRGIGAYPGLSPYRFSETLASVFAGAKQHIERPTHCGPHGLPSYDHKGFNWMALRRKLTARFQLEKTFGSPLTWLPPHLASQAWFVLGKNQPG